LGDHGVSKEEEDVICVYGKNLEAGFRLGSAGGRSG